MSTAPSADGERRVGSAAALAGLPGMGPRRLTALLDAWEPDEAWARVAAGRRAELAVDDCMLVTLGDSPPAVDAIVATWARAAAEIDVVAVAERHRAAQVTILLRDDAAYPEPLLADMEPPAVLFAHGDLAALDHRRAAVVGTRRCTGLGAAFARELGRGLAGADVAVVSGLALGVDGAAHRGALDARDDVPAGAAPVGVVGCGLDIVYPARHRQLWTDVAREGLLLSEAPLGARPTAWRFPARNRIIAALAEVVVVVESHRRGGSLLTVEEAQRRSVPVMAVPGSVRSPAAMGTNALIADGCHPVCDVDDVLIALGLTSRRRSARDPRPAPDATGRAVLDAFDWEPATLEQLAVRTSLPLAGLSVALEALLATGWVELAGGWYERVSAP